MALRPNSCSICGDQVALLQRAVLESDALVRDLQSIQERLTRQLNEKANELQRAVQDANTYQMQLLDSSLEITLLNNELSNVIPRLNGYEQTWQKQQHKMKLYRESAEESISKCAYLTERFKEKIDELEEEKSTVQALQKKNDSIAAINVKLSAECISLKAENERLCAEVEKMRADKQDSEHIADEQLRSLKGENAKLSADLFASCEKVQVCENILQEKAVILREKEDELQAMGLQLLEQRQEMLKEASIIIANATTTNEHKESKEKNKSKKLLRQEVVKQLRDLKRDVDQSCSKVDNIIVYDEHNIL